ncbi:hypothetical protein H0H81_009043, partial [Sphagnurus paluster]
MLGASVGLPAASLCINRRLYHIASVQSVAITPAENTSFKDTASIFSRALVATQQSTIHFLLTSSLECGPSSSASFLQPIVAMLSLRAFARRRLEFGRFLASNKSLTISRYFRLMALAATEIMLTTPLAVFLLWLNVTATPIDPWTSWADTHYDYSRVEQYPAIIWRNGNRPRIIAMELSRWVIPLCALVFFSFFGFAEEAKRNYRAAFQRIINTLGFSSEKLPYSEKKPNPSEKFGATPVEVPLSPLPSYSPPSSASTFLSTMKLQLSLSYYETYDEVHTPQSSVSPTS